jgi:hypothetical protein
MLQAKPTQTSNTKVRETSLEFRLRRDTRDAMMCPRAFDKPEARRA